jgi:hypothetical protein
VCQLLFDVEVPPGMSVAVERVSAHLHATVPSGQKALVRATAHFMGGAPGSSFAEAVIAGPVDGDITRPLVFAKDQMEWSACHQARMLTVTADLRAGLRDRPHPEQLTRLGSTKDGRVAFDYALVTRPCD